MYIWQYSYMFYLSPIHEGNLTLCSNRQYSLLAVPPSFPFILLSLPSFPCRIFPQTHNPMLVIQSWIHLFSLLAAPQYVFRLCPSYSLLLAGCYLLPTTHCRFCKGTETNGRKSHWRQKLTAVRLFRGLRYYQTSLHFFFITFLHMKLVIICVVGACWLLMAGNVASHEHPDEDFLRQLSSGFARDLDETGRDDFEWSDLLDDLDSDEGYVTLTDYESRPNLDPEEDALSIFKHWWEEWLFRYTSLSCYQYIPFKFATCCYPLSFCELFALALSSSLRNIDFVRVFLPSFDANLIPFVLLHGKDAKLCPFI